MGKSPAIIITAIISMAFNAVAAEKFDHRALLWWTPEKEIILAIDYYTSKADILMEIDWKKISSPRIILNHDLIFLVGIRQKRLRLHTYSRKKHRGLIKIGTLFFKKGEVIMLQNGINYNRKDSARKKRNNTDSPFKSFGVPGFQ